MSPPPCAPLPSGSLSSLLFRSSRVSGFDLPRWCRSPGSSLVEGSLVCSVSLPGPGSSLISCLFCCRILSRTGSSTSPVPQLAYLSLFPSPVVYSPFSVAGIHPPTAVGIFEGGNEGSENLDSRRSAWHTCAALLCRSHPFSFHATLVRLAVGSPGAHEDATFASLVLLSVAYEHNRSPHRPAAARARRCSAHIVSRCISFGSSLPPAGQNISYVSIGKGLNNVLGVFICGNNNLRQQLRR